jgi:SAM-dependent methyltransferase
VPALRRCFTAVALHALIAFAPTTQASEREPDVNYVPTPQHVVDDMLRLVDLRKGDVLYDLGSGDGRIPITAAARYGVRAVGIDIDPTRIEEAEANARERGVERLVTFRQEDLFQADFSAATVVTLYLFPDLNLKLRPRLLATLQPGTRIVSHRFDMGDWTPEKTLTIGEAVVYFWTVPRPTAAAPRELPANAAGLP